MKPIRHLSIPQPCSENWAEMAQTGAGERFCASCQHNVFDLTGRTDAEVLRLVAARSGDRICGRITTAQLDRINRGLAVTVRPSPVSRWSAALIILTGLTLAAPVATFARPPLTARTHLVASTTSPADAVPGDTVRTVVIEGYVLNAATGVGLDSAWVAVVQTQTNQRTDSTGYYRLEVPVSAEMQTVTLHVEHRTRAPKNDTITIFSMQSEIRCDFLMELMLTVDDVIVEADPPQVCRDLVGLLHTRPDVRSDEYWQTLMWRRVRPSLQPFEPRSDD